MNLCQPRREWLQSTVGFVLFAVIVSNAWQHVQAKQQGNMKPMQTVEEQQGRKKPKHTNRLKSETSPYLLQHAHNPVEWYPWGEEAFQAARKHGKPVLLSIGYSTCHWCHVMEEESFEDEEIAAFLNQHYVAIKVDREQRPDLDALYMAAVQALTGSGGWPMTVWLTPDRKPFFAGTYFPPRDGARGARVGFLTLLQRLSELYDNQRDGVVNQAEEIVRAIKAQMAPVPGEEMTGDSALKEASSWFAKNFDSVHGGFGSAPKFPRPAALGFLIEYGIQKRDEQAVEMATHTLKQMARGGMYDQLAGGFHRYSVDQQWLVPHFEKMLYDQAQLVVVYLDAFQITKDEEFAETARQTLDYILREMTASHGGFYSATDADSEGEEGTYFVWSQAEILSLLGKEEGALFSEFYGVTLGGNFEGKNILHVQEALNEFARRKHLNSKELRSRLDAGREKLYHARSKRPPPLTDDKVITAWNGLMIGALARGFWVLGDRRYADAAVKAARFVMKELEENGRLKRSFRVGRSQGEAYLDDYAFMIWGLLELYEVTGDVAWLEKAIGYQNNLLDQFEDPTGGGFFLTSSAGEPILARPKPYYDGAEPSGNSVSGLNLIKLATITDNQIYARAAQGILKAFGKTLKSAPHVSPLMLTIVASQDGNVPEIVLALAEPFPFESSLLLPELRRSFVLSKARVLIPAEIDRSALERLVPLAKSRVLIGGKETAYVCRGNYCDLPTSDPKVLARQIDGRKS